ncbi:MAG: type II secretion system GspH family protein [Clostridiaceae bacterium]|jgi:prepilin-type N-terminal cleavage/methylation domain-containing protein|nr:type II secretion system GspH family protein [Clostridiaceae bacterium]
MKNKQKSGFTLAEVLITLGIIGVVAALTLPSLIQNNREQENIAKLAKIYNTLDNSLERAVTENGTVDSWGLTGNNDTSYDIFWNNIVPYLNIAKACQHTGDDGCVLSYERYSLTGKTSKANDKYAGRNFILLADGTVISLTWFDNTNCSMVVGTSEPLKHVCGDLLVDTNGQTKPNITGKDIFDFYITKDKFIPVGTANETRRGFPNFCSKTNNDSNNGYACTAWVIFSKNMDYLHCDGLSWTGKTKCK